MNWTKEPIVIIICPHFWRREWWRQRHCRMCRTWMAALVSINEIWNDVPRDTT